MSYFFATCETEVTINPVRFSDYCLYRRI